MTNPWLRIPASDYEGHMSSPNVAQQSFLAQTFKESLDKYDCSAIALLGCATGNGLEYIKKDATQRVTAIDINPEYLKVLRQRYEGCVPGLEIVEADLEMCILENQAYSLIYAGLVFEYIEPRILLPKIATWLSADGIMISILQLPSKHSTRVSETPYTSLKALESIMKLVSPEQFKSIAKDAGLQEKEARTIALKSGKPFFIGTYTRI
jgi:SAM-dependent methyltransferase